MARLNRIQLQKNVVIENYYTQDDIVLRVIILELRQVDLSWDHLGRCSSRLIRMVEDWRTGRMLIWRGSRNRCGNSVWGEPIQIILHSSLNFAYVYLLYLLTHRNLHAFILWESDPISYQVWPHFCVELEQGETFSHTVDPIVLTIFPLIKSPIMTQFLCVTFSRCFPISPALFEKHLFVTQ